MQLPEKKNSFYSVALLGGFRKALTVVSVYATFVAGSACL